VPESYSDRGFAQYGTVSTPDGLEVRVYESSSAEEPHVWLSLEGDCHLRSEPRPCPGIECGIAEGHAAAHLNIERAQQVRDLLDEWLFSALDDAQQGGNQR
jgi:hypothetical protein